MSLAESDIKFCIGSSRAGFQYSAGLPMAGFQSKDWQLGTVPSGNRTLYSVAGFGGFSTHPPSLPKSEGKEGQFPLRRIAPHKRMMFLGLPLWCRRLRREQEASAS